MIRHAQVGAFALVALF